MPDSDRTLLYVGLGAAAYLLFIRQPPRAGAPISGAFTPTGSRISAPGVFYSSGPGGTQIAIDPAILRGLFGQPPSGTLVGGPDVAPPDSPVFLPDYPPSGNFQTPFYPVGGVGGGVIDGFNPAPDYDPCYYNPTDFGCAGFTDWAGLREQIGQGGFI